jgi:hypothetical protein
MGWRETYSAKWLPPVRYIRTQLASMRAGYVRHIGFFRSCVLSKCVHRILRGICLPMAAGCGQCRASESRFGTGTPKQWTLMFSRVAQSLARRCGRRSILSRRVGSLPNKYFFAPMPGAPSGFAALPGRASSAPARWGEATLAKDLAVADARSRFEDNVPAPARQEQNPSERLAAVTPA